MNEFLLSYFWKIVLFMHLLTKILVCYPIFFFISKIIIAMVIIMIEYLQHKKLRKSIYLHIFFFIRPPAQHEYHAEIHNCRLCKAVFCSCCGNMTFMLTINVRNKMRNNFLFCVLINQFYGVISIECETETERGTEKFMQIESRQTWTCMWI